ncbi:hypothetical protein QQ045_006900 [Rhodiola kirilowii]
MNKLLEFGRKAMFYARVLSGYEERRIRSYRLQLQQRVQQAEAKKAALNNVPEKIILSEVRQMVEHMQSVNKKIEETETSIQEYLNSIDKDADMIVKMQLDGEEKTMKRMAEAMRNQALLEKVEADSIVDLQNAESNKGTRSVAAEIFPASFLLLHDLDGMMQLVRSKLQSPGIFYTRVLLHGYQWMKAVFTSRKQRRKQENEGFPISVASNTKALAENEGEGIAKMIYRPDTGDIKFAVHAHPTLSEVLDQLFKSAKR